MTKPIKKILIDNSGYELKNFGDVAMLSAAVSHLTNYFPDAEIYIFTDSAERLHKFIPSAIAVSLLGRRQWHAPWHLFGGMHKVIPRYFHAHLRHLESLLSSNYYYLAKRWTLYRLKRKHADITAILEYFNLLEKADLVIATGGGYITDSFKSHAINLLLTLHLAQNLGKPTALLGQGLGPVTDEEMLSWAKKVFQKLLMLTLREQVFSEQLAITLGVSTAKLITTGDDAIELAYQNKSPNGRSIGINLRVASYSGLQVEDLDTVKQVLTQLATVHNAALIPIPISIHEGDSDVRSLQLLLGENAGQESSQIESIEQLIEQIAQCRIVITGSYHAGVFALSQGISVVGVAASDYYRQKFEGLIGQFGQGIYIVDTDKPNFDVALSVTAATAWREADVMRANLLAKAQQQIDLAESAYQRLRMELSQN